MDVAKSSKLNLAAATWSSTQKRSTHQDLSGAPSFAWPSPPRPQHITSHHSSFVKALSTVGDTCRCRPDLLLSSLLTCIQDSRSKKSSALAFYDVHRVPVGRANPRNPAMRLRRPLGLHRLLKSGHSGILSPTGCLHQAAAP